ncbi:MULTISPECIES: D-alanyl-D-alanine carboxypeptidase family protein [Streptomyces]|uniref:D-alanyl-D-alanine carboxypeptidase family protein n=1 Tax=Streptomyces TaxID=1883 RepID=UPI00081B8488|nr:MULTISPECIES: serine hydrolase [unclassified Streptomyces]MYQ49854.1 D-alanyl-D-alanine carboxypeptidase [Streptomyces sp. SID4941]SCD28582.1 D-alanyl-D-alanine carboxypeptidase (penicillin-binding protein 5/6) [Streptomyces sp. PalvLS-984]SDC97525.1 D-alanyl-D-alanine carboxypeptidase (penicillin-binding protein 5/6) [Streptomyces sp. AmelKG-A3]
MGLHARPSRIHRTGARFATVALVGAVLPITAGGLAEAATSTVTQVADSQGEGAPAVGNPSAPDVAADNAFLLDARDGSQERAMWAGARADESVSMASTTKIMTALVVLQHPEWLDRQITVKQEYRDYVAENGASTADLQTGDKLTTRQLLHAMLIPSGGDAAMALADSFGNGDTQEARIADFENQMNAQAQQLGLTGTHFDSFDGISHGDNRSTARDLAKLGQRAMLKPVFADIVKLEQFETEAPAANGRIRYYTWNTTNDLLSTYDGALGVKTGSGAEAGYSLVFAAERDNRTLVGAIVGADQEVFGDAAKILDWGFTH